MVVNSSIFNVIEDSQKLVASCIRNNMLNFLIKPVFKSGFMIKLVFKLVFII
jgi:hypothetical protein